MEAILGRGAAPRAAALALALTCLSARADAQGRERRPPRCAPGSATVAVNDAGEARCVRCQPGMVTVADREGWTSCVIGETDYACPPGSGLSIVPHPLVPVDCLPCRKGEESAVIMAAGMDGPQSVCVTRRCDSGTVPVRVPGLITDYECVRPLEKKVDWAAVWPAGRESNPALAPTCPRGDCVRYQPDTRTLYCAAPGAQEFLETRRGWPVCVSSAARVTGGCGQKKVRARGGGCFSCPKGSRISNDPGITECVPGR